MILKKLVLISLALFISLETFALDSFFNSGYGRGGTSLSDVTGGQDYNTQAGSGLFLIGGVLIPISPTTPHRFEAQIGMGYLFQYDARDADKTVSWSRIPLEAIYFYRNTKDLFRFGWGLIYHMNNRITAQGSNSSAATSVDNALGWTIVLEELFRNKENNNFLTFGLKSNFIKYKSSSFSKDADGSSFFLTIGYLWL